MSELKRCPFGCSEPVIITKHHREDLWRLLHRCRSVGPISIDWTSRRDLLVTAWNTRADEAIRRETIEECANLVIDTAHIEHDGFPRSEHDYDMLSIANKIRALADQPKERK